MKRFRFVLINDLKAYMEDRAIVRTNLLYLAILFVILLVGWPGGAPFDFQRPYVFLAITYAQIILLSYIGGRLAVRSSSVGDIKVADWLKYTPLSPMEIALGKLLAIFLCLLLMFSSSLPLLILCYFIGGVSLKASLTVYCLLPIFFISFISFGLLFSLVSRDFSVFILNLSSFLFVLGLFLSRTGWRNLFYLNPRFVLFILVLSTFAFSAFIRDLRRRKKLAYED